MHPTHDNLVSLALGILVALAMMLLLRRRRTR